jgi:pimeloyl-ACP methyl ester carboxylesterase
MADAMPPTLVVHDRNDREVGFDQGQAIAEAWPRARLLATEGLGHRRLLRDPAVIGAVTAFVTGDAGARRSA